MASQRDPKKDATWRWALAPMARPTHLCVRAALPGAGLALTNSIVLRLAGRQLLSCMSTIRQGPSRRIVRVPARTWKSTRHITVPGVKLEAINEDVSHFRSGSFLHVGHDANG